METPEFEWDEEKAVSNLKKHDVSFEEGATSGERKRYETN